MNYILAFTGHIYHGISDPLSFELRLPQDPKHQLRIELFPGPRGHSLVIELIRDLSAVHPILLKPKNAVYQGLMGRI